MLLFTYLAIFVFGISATVEVPVNTTACHIGVEDHFFLEVECAEWFGIGPDVDHVIKVSHLVIMKSGTRIYSSSNVGFHRVEQSIRW